MNSPEKPEKLNQPKARKNPFKRILTAGILILLPFLFFVNKDIAESDLDPLSFPSPNLQIGEEPPKLNLQEESHLSIQLNTKSIHASSLKEQIFPMFVSRKIPDFQSPYRKPVDLICVFSLEQSEYYHHKMQIADIKKSFRHLLSWMADQDRLSIVLFERTSYVDNLAERIHQTPRSKISPLKNTTLKNKREIISAIGGNIVSGEMSIWRALEAAKMVLEQRAETSQTTAIFIMKPSDGLGGYENSESLHSHIQAVDRAKADLGLENKGLIIQPFLSSYKQFGEPFVEIFKTLRGGVVETEFLVKPQESEIFKGVQINTYKGFYYDGLLWYGDNAAFFTKKPSVKPGLQEELLFDLKIPRVTQDLSSSPMEIKVASCQLTYRLVDGSEVVKKADLTVKIFGEREEFVAEEEDKVKVKEFYRKWSEDWLFHALLPMGNYDGDWGKAWELFEKYRESLGSSIVKDDEELQNSVKEMKKSMERHEKVIYCD